MLPMIRRLEATACATVLTGAASPTYALRHRSVSVHSRTTERCCSPPDVVGAQSVAPPTPGSPLLKYGFICRQLFSYSF